MGSQHLYLDSEFLPSSKILVYKIVWFVFLIVLTCPHHNSETGTKL